MGIPKNGLFDAGSGPVHQVSIAYNHGISAYSSDFTFHRAKGMARQSLNRIMVCRSRQSYVLVADTDSTQVLPAAGMILYFMQEGDISTLIWLLTGLYR